MKHSKKLGYIALGAVMAFTLNLTVPALAAGTENAVKLLEAYFTSGGKPISIYIDGDKVNITQKDSNGDVVQPFISDGATYLPVKSVAEAFGKTAEWDDATASVYIGKRQQSQFSETFTDGPLSKYWDKTGTWDFDGQSGVKGGYGSRMNLTSAILPDQLCDYTVEFEAAAYHELGRDHDWLFIVYLGVDDKGKWTDSIIVDGASTRDSGVVVHGTINKVNERNEDKVQIATIPSILLSQYTSVKIQVKEQQANIYLNGEYITSEKLESKRSAFSFYGQFYYVRNFMITVGG